MSSQKIHMEDRLRNMRNIYKTIDQLFDTLPEGVPVGALEKVKKAILGNEDLKKLIEDVDSYRPPRILLVGRTGVGKSSLINAICDAYTAPVSDVNSCTQNVNIYNCTDGDRILMEIMDSRGIAESTQLNSEISAEEQLIRDINDFSPDVLLLVLPANARDNIDADVDFLKSLRQHYYAHNLIELPIIAVINKIDAVSPARETQPKFYSENKLENIKKIKDRYKTFFVKNGLRVDETIEVSSLIDWEDKDKNPIRVDDIEFFSNEEKEQLEIAFDGRYNIDKLREVMETVIKDPKAIMGLKMAFKIKVVMSKVVNQIIAIFSTIATVISTTPLPVADIYILLAIQSIMITMIAALSGREVNANTGKEFILSLGGVGAAGLVFKLVAQQTSKLANLAVPGAGSAISSAVAGAGTYSMGKAAETYYLDGEDIKKAIKVKKQVDAEMKKRNKK